MTVQEFLLAAVQRLKGGEIPSPRLDCLILLEDALGIDRAALLAHPEMKISSPKLTVLNKQITRRLTHEPLAYIRGRASFFGYEFSVSPDVLVPRPETETMIEILKQVTKPAASVTIIDVGTGSGAIAITAKLQLPWAHVIAIDIDPAALSVARRNARKLGATVRFVRGDLLASSPRSEPLLRDSIVLANLPYVPDRYRINEAARHEPKHAIFGGKDGLDLYRRLWTQMQSLAEPPLFVLTETLPPQHPAMQALARPAGYSMLYDEDFIQAFRRRND